MCKKIPLPKEIRITIGHHTSLCDLMEKINKNINSMSETYDLENSFISEVLIEFNLSQHLPIHTAVVKTEQSIKRECVCCHD